MLTKIIGYNIKLSFEKSKTEYQQTHSNQYESIRLYVLSFYMNWTKLAIKKYMTVVNRFIEVNAEQTYFSVVWLSSISSHKMFASWHMEIGPKVFHMYEPYNEQ